MVSRRIRPAAPADVDPADLAPADAVSEDGSEQDPVDASEAGGPPLDGLPIAGITRRRLAWIVAAVVSIWIVAIFARQVGQASDATARAERIRDANAELAANVDALTRERDLIQRQAYIAIVARNQGLGEPKERAFTLAADAPRLAADAPGSTAVRLGAAAGRPAPFEVWLDLLFGTGR
jgi:cell division protein FtsB